MIRIVLVGWSENDWRILRQEQWMAEVRRDPSASGFSKAHFDIEEANYRALVEAWAREGLGSSRPMAVDQLARSGAVEVAPG
jgi:hypothetical protein